MDDLVTLRPVIEDDLSWLASLRNGPAASGLHEWHGWSDPQRERRQWAESGLLGDHGGTLIVLHGTDRVDPAFAAARAAVAAGDLGMVHTVRSTTLDPAPPPRAYLAASGGIFRDCAVHDFDAVRWVTGQEVTEVYAAGTNQDARWFGELGDVHTASAVLTLDGGALGVVSNTRFNARGHDVRLEVHGTRDTWRPDWDRGFRCGRPSRACRFRTASRSHSSWTG
jgi:hypothetical protein